MPHPTQTFNSAIRGSWLSMPLPRVNTAGLRLTIHRAAALLRHVADAFDERRHGQTEQAKHSVIIDGAPNGMLLVDEAGIITLANAQAATIFGYPADALVGRPVEILVPEQRRPALARMHKAGTGTAACKTVRPREFSGRRRDGSKIMVQLLMRPVRTPHGSATVVSIVDLTERLRRQAEEASVKAAEQAAVAAANARLEQLARDLAQARDKAEQANQAKSRFLTGITHELRTPLNGILGYAQLLRVQGDLNPQQATHVQAMLGAGEHLLGMINAVLDLSQIEAEQLELLPVDIELRCLARACLDVVRPAAQAKRLAIGLVVAPMAPQNLFADATRLRQVLVNLLGNAVKFTASGHIELRLLPALKTAGIRLEVVDTGPGISPAQRSRLFHEFERLDHAATSEVEGSGLGLAIAARLVTRMGGQIGHAANPDGGSVFWIEIPAKNAAADALPHVVAVMTADVRPARTHRILVVDDVAMNRDIASALLRAAGHVVTCADSGPAAIMAVAEGNFDVVLMDVRMPGMDGLTATRHIRALPAPACAVPVLAVTAQAFSEQIAQCRAAGMNGHVSKPLDHGTLLTAIATALARPIKMPAQASLDDAVYRAMSRVLSPADLDRHLETLIRCGESLLTQLAETGEAFDSAAVAEAAHRLGGSAGTLGFRRLAAAASRF